MLAWQTSDWRAFGVLAQMILDRLATSLGRNDEVPNQDLAREIVAANDAAAVDELVGLLTHANKAVRHDAIKALYEVAQGAPGLVAMHDAAFVTLITGKDNRLVWGGMTALGCIAPLAADRLWPQVSVIQKVTDGGSVITQDWGIRTLARIAAARPEYEAALREYLIAFLGSCIPSDVPRHAESMLVAVNDENRSRFLAALNTRLPECSPSQVSRLKRVIRQIG